MNHQPVATERWLPSQWDHIVGNDEVTEHSKDIIWSVRVRNEHRGHNLLVYGPSRSGKTASLKLLARCLLCQKLDTDTLDPCSWECEPCKQDAARFGLRGIETQIIGARFHYLPIDCTSLAEGELREKLMELRDYDGVRVIYLDEVHRLARRNMDEQLLKQMDEKDFIWIASAISVKELEDAFLNRFSVKIKTELPAVGTLAVWLAQRSLERQITYDTERVFPRLAERANGIPGLALQVLARADSSRRRVLTMEMVERHRFSCEE
jgi:Holliday junction resolvasome RuvABC ATP-dependent DNA helicase subunit